MPYAHPEVLVETKWVEEHLNDPKVRLVEVDYDATANYGLGHVPGAVLFDWRKDLNHPVQRDILTREQLEELLGKAGVTPDTKIVLYGDFNNWFAAYAFWDLQYYGVENVKLMNGGRKKWIEEGRPISTVAPTHPPTSFKVSGPRKEIRAFRDEVMKSLDKKGVGLVDVRAPEEYSGELLAPEDLPQEGSQRAGHIPGAKNIPWGQALKEDGTFKSRAELEQLYGGQGITPDKNIITYCRIGERSAHTWFVLTHLLGYPNVRNYDGSWTEWGSLVGAPIEK